MSVNELRASLGAAIADLEKAKLRLLEVFEWGSTPKATRPEERGKYGMNIQAACAALPVIDRELRRAIKILLGTEPPEFGANRIANT